MLYMRKQSFVVLLAALLVCVGGTALASGKKGFGVDYKKDPLAYEKASSLNLAWFYTWDAIGPVKSPAGVEFVPMIWSHWNASEEVLNQLAAKNYSTVLGFNEPEQHDQANMTVDEVLEKWPLLMETGIRLGSPAGVHPDGEWMQEFMKKADELEYRVDFITVHSYKGVDAKYFLAWLEKIHTLYNRPIWITEFAVGDWDAGPAQANIYSPEEVHAFMKEVMPALEGLPYVERYAWFSAALSQYDPLGSSALFNEDGSLTPLGELYASY